MTKITSYKTKKGETRFEFQAYLGVDPQTGKSRSTHRRGFKSKQEAKVVLSRLSIDAADNKLPEPKSNITFNQVYREWYAAYINTVRESTWARTAGMFKNHIIPEFGDKRIRTITTDQIQRAVNKWFKLAPNNFKRWYWYTRDVIDYAIRHKYMSSDNPALIVTLPKKEIAWDEPENFWNKEELIRFFGFINLDDELEKYTLFRILAFTGIRRGECLALMWTDINFSKSILTVNKTATQGKRGQTIIQPPKTRAGRRTIVLDDNTLRYLKKWRKEQRKTYFERGINTMQPDQLIFANSKNGFKSLNTPSKWLHAIIDKPENNLSAITIHGFRHTHATMMFLSGASLKEVQTRLGHDDAQTTLNIYTHITQQEDVEAAKKISGYLGF